MLLVLHCVLHLLSLLSHVLLRSVFSTLIRLGLLHYMTPTEALEQGNNTARAREGEIKREQPEEQRQIAPAVWLRGDLLAEAWRSSDDEREPDVAAYYARGHNHDETTIGNQASSCISSIHESGEVASSRAGVQSVEEICDPSSPPEPVSASSPLRLNRFERRQRDPEEDMHLLIIRRQVKRQTNGELKFRTDFDSCFKDFPLENIYVPHWTCRTPVSAQASVRNFCEPKAAAVVIEEPPVPWRRHDDLDECDIYEYAKLHGLMDDVVLPRNSDGTLMAELDATPIERSPKVSARTTSKSARSSAFVTSMIPVPRVAPDRLAKKLAALHPLSWARKASLHIRPQRDSGKVQRPSIPDSISSATEQHDSPVSSWTIEATEDGLLYYHSAFEKGNERSVPSLINSVSTPVELDVDQAFPPPLPMIGGECDESHSEYDSDNVAKVEEVVVGGCWVSVASEEQ